MYSVGAVRQTGVLLPELFFGLEELEYGLRLRRAGHSIYAHGPMWLEERKRNGNLQESGRPSWRVGDCSWRRYYSIRNLIVILRLAGRPGAALRITLLLGLGKPIANWFLDLLAGARYVLLGLRASVDAWTGKLGRTVDPTHREERPERLDPVEDRQSGRVSQAPSGGIE